jgi:hypothetical protein
MFCQMCAWVPRWVCEVMESRRRGDKYSSACRLQWVCTLGDTDVFITLVSCSAEFMRADFLMRVPMERREEECARSRVIGHGCALDAVNGGSPPSESFSESFGAKRAFHSSLRAAFARNSLPHSCCSHSTIIVIRHCHVPTITYWAFSRRHCSNTYIHACKLA